MTTQTHPVGATTHHTEQTLKARYEEALEVLDAWRDRARLSGGADRRVAEVGLADAESWVLVCRADYRAALVRAAGAGVRRPQDRGGVAGRGGAVLGPEKRAQLVLAASTIRASRRRRHL